MSASIALLCLQATEDGRAIAEAIREDNEGVVITNKTCNDSNRKSRKNYCKSINSF